MARQLSRLQKASALVPMAVLVGAWGAALTNSGLAIAVGGSDPDAIPDVPSSAFDQPATVQKSPGGIDPRAGADGAVSTLSTNGIPSAALFSYRRAETLLSKADASCKLPWNLVAALGRVESNHGRSNGNALSADGLAEPGIYGAPLNGNGVAKISDTDNGSLDKDTVWDRAVGPMQFIPGTWANVGVDSDNDGKKNPQDIDDAATAAGIYLCAGSDDLSTDGGARAAVHRYNHSDSYVDLVMKISAAYANGEFSQSPDGYPSSSIITSQSNDQTLGPKARAKAKKDQQQAENPKPGTGSWRHRLRWHRWDADPDPDPAPRRRRHRRRRHGRRQHGRRRRRWRRQWRADGRREGRLQSPRSIRPRSKHAWTAAGND